MTASKLHPTHVTTSDTDAAATRVSRIPSVADNDDGSKQNRRFVDGGLPIPDGYDLDIIRAMVQDPYRVFVYWDIRQQSIDDIAQLFPSDDPAVFKTILKVIEISEGHEAYLGVQRQGGYWVSVSPGHEYQFEIGVRSPKLGYRSLVRSNRVRAPIGTVSSLVSDQAKYRLNPKEFAQVLEASGFSAALASQQKAEDQRQLKLIDDSRETILSGRSSGLNRVGSSSRLG